MKAKEDAKLEAKEASKSSRVSKKKSDNKFELIERDDMVISLESKVGEFQTKNERAPTASELNELYAEVYV